jgi:Zn-dependent protease
MHATDSILNFSIPLGSVRGIRVRVSILLLVTMLAISWRLGSLPLGLLASAILAMGVILHQVAQVFVAQATGSDPADVVLWPLGGLTTHGADAGFPNQAQIQLVGIVVNLATAAICLFQLQHVGIAIDPVTLLQGLQVDSSEALSLTAVRMMCFTSLLLLSANLLPVLPFDGGRLLKAFLSERYDRIEVNDVMLRLGLVVSLLGLAVAFIFDQSAIVALSSFVLIVHLHEVGIRSASTGYFDVAQSSENWEDELSGMDPELEPFDSFGNSEDVDTDEIVARSSMLARRRARRESEERQREAEEREREEKQLDAILERIHREGEEALKPAELRLLKRASQRLKSKSKSPRPNSGQ